MPLVLGQALRDTTCHTNLRPCFPIWQCSLLCYRQLLILLILSLGLLYCFGHPAVLFESYPFWRVVLCATVGFDMEERKRTFCEEPINSD